MKKWLIILSVLIVGCSKGGDSTPRVIPPGPECTAFVTWQYPNTRANGQLLAADEVAKSTIYISNSNTVDEQFVEFTIDVTNGTSWEVRNLTSGEHWFYLNITDLENLTSGFSNLMSKICP